MRTRLVGTATVLGCLAGAAVLATALAVGPGAPLSHRVVAPGVTGGQGVDALAFPTVPPGAPDHCVQLQDWEYRQVVGFDTTYEAFRDGAVAANITGAYIDQPVVNIDAALPEDTEEAYVVLQFGGPTGDVRRLVGARLWGYADGHWRQAIRVDDGTFDAYEVVSIQVCVRRGAESVQPAVADLQTVALDPLQVVPSGIPVGSAPGRFLVTPSGADAAGGLGPYYFRPPGGPPGDGDIVEIPLSPRGVPLVVPEMWPAPTSGSTAEVVRQVDYPDDRTGFVVNVVPGETTWNGTLFLEFPNGFEAPFPVPRLLHRGEGRTFLLNMPDSLIGGAQSDEVDAVFTGGTGASTAPQQAHLVQGDAVLLYEGELLHGWLPVCNPFAFDVAADAYPVDLTHYDTSWLPDAMVTATYTGLVPAGGCVDVGLPPEAFLDLGTAEHGLDLPPAELEVFFGTWLRFGQ